VCSAESRVVAPGHGESVPQLRDSVARRRHLRLRRLEHDLDGRPHHRVPRGGRRRRLPLPGVAPRVTRCVSHRTQSCWCSLIRRASLSSVVLSRCRGPRRPYGENKAIPYVTARTAARLRQRTIRAARLGLDCGPRAGLSAAVPFLTQTCLFLTQICPFLTQTCPF